MNLFKFLILSNSNFFIKASKRTFTVALPNTKNFLFLDQNGSTFISNDPPQEFSLYDDGNVTIANKKYYWYFNNDVIYVISDLAGRNLKKITIEKVKGGSKIHIGDKCAELSYNKLKGKECKDKLEQIFDIQDAIPVTKTFFVRKIGTKKYLKVDSNESKFIEGNVKGKRQKFLLSEDRTVKNQNDKQVLDKQVWDYAYRQNYLYLNKKHGKDNQLFTLEKVKGGYSIHVQDRCAVIINDSIKFEKCNSESNQIFDIGEGDLIYKSSEPFVLKYKGRYLNTDSGTLMLSDKINPFKFAEGTDNIVEVVETPGIGLEVESTLTFVNTNFIKETPFMNFEFVKYSEGYKIMNHGKCLWAKENQELKLTECEDDEQQIFEISTLKEEELRKECSVKANPEIKSPSNSNISLNNNSVHSSWPSGNSSNNDKNDNFNNLNNDKNDNLNNDNNNVHNSKNSNKNFTNFDYYKLDFNNQEKAKFNYNIHSSVRKRPLN